MSTIDNQVIYWILLASFLMPIVLFGLLIWFLHKYQTKKYQHEALVKDNIVREQAVIIEKHELLEKERQRIASEMHDDLGSGLTRIKFMSQNLKSNTHSDDNDANDIAVKISTISSELVSNMSEIIWALNSRFDHVKDLIGYIRRYVSEYLEERNIDFEFENLAEIDDSEISGEKRRNIFLAMKEIIHNSVKYSNAGKIKIVFSVYDVLKITVCEEGGIGFDYNDQQSKGNGIYNIINRIESIKGKILFQKEEVCMMTIISIPIAE